MPFNRAAYNDDQLTRYTNVTAQGEVVPADVNDIPAIAGAAKHAIVVRRIVINVYTSAAQAFEFRGDGADGVPIFNKAASPAVGPHEIDWGPLGYQLPVGEGLEIALGATGGNGFSWLAEAYRVPVTTMIPSEVR